MGPDDALKRVAFLLEAEGAPAYKVQAFRRAAAVVSATQPGELLSLNKQDRLETLTGIGPSTAGVIREALAGAYPSYLAALEERAGTLTPGPAQDLLARLKGDCHSHSDWSDGGSPVKEMAEAAREIGHEYLALTDHSPRLTIAHGLSPDDLRRQLDLVAELNDDLHPFRLLTGIEVDILEDGSLDQEEELLARLDLVVASAHSALRMEAAKMTERLVRAVSNPHVDILGHCTGRIVVGRGRPQSQFDHEAVFGACAANGTAVEVNSRPDRLDPPEELMRLAATLRCRFAIDSDAHAPGQLRWLSYGCDKAVAADLEAPSIVNTLPLAEFIAWAGRDRRQTPNFTKDR
ncbi:MAG TPA: PHP domain-containing protein [Acidimicrobiales bacterium]|nr:PHP domain-containing protein [Acidimicrobiales bacterium]